VAYTTVDKSTDFFTPTTYVGNGSEKTVTGIPFEPDMTWLKNRSAVGDNEIYDKLRGATYRIYPNTNGAQDALAQGLKAWTSDGFTVGNNNAINGNGNNQISWNWKMNGTGASNTAGSINTTKTSANTTSGCALITYTGTGANATIGHGLGIIPTFIIFRRYAQAENWNVYHQSIGNAKSLRLNETGAAANDTTALNSATPTSSLISLGSSVNTNANGNPMIAWVFSDVQGFSKASSYVGNGSADGTFVYTGFKPAWVLIKDSGRSESWYIFDNKRLGYNGGMADLIANSTAAESSSSATLLDLVSNGFKLRGTTDHLNGSGQNFIYMAFAENPFVTSTGIPGLAR
tara:strand:- start:40 stop:1077 length:1038 start_codon:yes stop_codon:yes gene_type:complete